MDDVADEENKDKVEEPRETVHPTPTIARMPTTPTMHQITMPTVDVAKLLETAN